MSHLKTSLVSVLLSTAVFAGAESASIAPKFLLSASEPNSAILKCDKTVSCDVVDGHFVMTVAAGESSWPGMSVTPRDGVWDLSPWGHIEVEMKNPGAEPLSVGLRVDNNGNWQDQPWNCENVYLKPGEKKIAKVIFGFSYGFQKAYKLNPSAVSAVRIFLNGKKDVERKLILGDVMAAGATGEKPAVDPNRVVVKPANGVVPGTPLKVSVARKGAFVPLKPKSGYWNFNEWLKIEAVVKNTGSAPVTPTFAIDAQGDKIYGKASRALAPGEQTTIVVPFAPKEPWHAVGDARDVKPTGGTKFESHRVKGFNFTCTEDAGEYTVLSVVAKKIIAQNPSWLGKRPPVAGNWTLTLCEEFNGKTLDESVWSPYATNFWDKRTHFTRENILFKDGKCILRYEKKRGAKNDNPELGTTDYACGILNSYDHWTQLYGYFEARMKLPRAPGMWPAFWMMPDRGPCPPGKDPKTWWRNDTKQHGMEFDIMEHLTAWGPYRFNIACHWDGYNKDHRAIGTAGVYVPGDKDDFITIGMLWLPGVFAVYGNGVELARWESERVSTVPAHTFFYMVSGGWANEPLDDDLLPADFEIDYFRVWQRDDLR